MNAPVVHRDREIEQPQRTAGKVEIDHAPYLIAIPQHVVAEETRVHRALRQVFERRVALEAVLMDDLFGEQLESRVVQERLQSRRSALPPPEAAQVRLEMREIAACFMHARQQNANRGALRR